MKPLSTSDVFLRVAIMSVTFLTEIALFIFDLKESHRSVQSASDAKVLVLSELDG